MYADTCPWLPAQPPAHDTTPLGRYASQPVHRDSTIRVTIAGQTGANTKRSLALIAVPAVDVHWAFRSRNTKDHRVLVDKPFAT